MSSSVRGVIARSTFFMAGVIAALHIMSMPAQGAVAAALRTAPLPMNGPEPVAVDSARLQTIRGVVIDAVSNAPIVGATVAVVDSGRKVQGAIVQKGGVFKIKNVPVGRHTLRVTAVGYEPWTNDNVLVTAGKEVVITVSLTESFSATDEVRVTFDRELDVAITNNEYSSVSARAFNVEDTKRYAGSLGDPSRMAANFAGVVGANDARNDIIVRGNAPNAMLWQMEGMNIPNPNHFGALGSTGGPVSMINNNVLEKSDFMTSAFPAMYGNAVGGAFDLKVRDGNTEQYEFLAQMGFNGLEFGAEGPLWNGASFLVNYRYSTLAVFNELGIDIGTGGAVPNYQDLTVKLQSPVGERGRLSLFAVGGLSDVKLFGDQLDTNSTDLYGDRNRNQIADYRTGWAGLQYEHRLDDDTYLRAMLGVSGLDEAFDAERLHPITREASLQTQAYFTTETVSAVASVRRKFGSATSVTAGVQVDAQTYHLYNRDDIGTPFEKTFVDITDRATLSQGYVQLKQRLTDWFTLNAGVHAQHYTIGDAMAIEPRVGLTANLSSTISINAGYGLHSQRQGIYAYNVQTPTPTGVAFTNRDLDLTRSHHSVLGMDWFLSDAIRMKVEGYYQSLFDVPVTRDPSSYSALNSGASFAPDNKDSLVNTGTGRNYGLELTIEHFFRDGFFFLLTTSLFDSKYTGSDGVERNTAFNTNYVVNVLGGKEFRASDNGVLSLNARVSTTGGRRLTPIDVQASRLAREAVYRNDLAYTDQQPAYFRFDLKLGYRIEFGGSTLEFSVDLQNVTNHKNVFIQRYNVDKGVIETEYQQGFFPVPTVRFTF